jgi:gamma-glutamyltranspeptidase/glutathione hydrolase/leukotriene-C4 hydrolase
LKGYAEAHKRFGRLPWSSLFEPAIELCETGFRIGYQLAYNIKRAEADIRRNKMLSSILLDKKTGKILVENNVIKCEALARTLRLVATHGPDVIYNGNLTATIVSEINANEGNFTVQDLNDYRVGVYENANQVQLDDEYKMFVPPPPSSAILVAYVLQVMRGYELKPECEMSDMEKRLFYHRFIESLKHSYAIRDFLGDEKFVNVTYVNKFANNLRKFLKCFYLA